MILKVKRTEDAKQFPLLHIAKDGDAGLDLFSCLPMKEDGSRPDIVIQPGERGVIPTGIRIELPEGYYATVEARSSTGQNCIIQPKGVLDEGYRGEVFAQLINASNYPFTVRHGDRLVQMIVHERLIKDFEIIEVDELSKSVRGESGFGSTGVSEFQK